MNFMLICTKTGRHWPCFDHAHGDRMARNKGLKDYEINPVETVK